jgi:hypothetical protein
MQVTHKQSVTQLEDRIKVKRKERGKKFGATTGSKKPNGKRKLGKTKSRLMDIKYKKYISGKRDLKACFSFIAQKMQ